MKRFLSWLLLPFSWLYAAVLAGRNWLYDKGWKKSYAFGVPLVGVGNLRVGGTGKTPHVAWLVQELQSLGHCPAILSRGYGRATTGPRLAGPMDSAATVGDEPWQYFEQFGRGKVPVAVAEKRRLGASLLLHRHPEITVIVLDDAYQHRALQPAPNILLTEWERPFYADFVLPAGRLREARVGARRADLIIVTKCPVTASTTSQRAVAAQVARYTRPGVPVLFSAYAYAPPQPLTQTAATSSPLPGPALLLTGIAQPGPLREHLQTLGYAIQYHAQLPDHHVFTPQDLVILRSHWQPGWPVFTTTKDAARLQTPPLLAALAGLPVYAIPVAVTFLGDGAARLRTHLSAPDGHRVGSGVVVNLSFSGFVRNYLI